MANELRILINAKCVKAARLNKIILRKPKALHEQPTPRKWTHEVELTGQLLRWNYILEKRQSDALEVIELDNDVHLSPDDVGIWWRNQMETFST